MNDYACQKPWIEIRRKLGVGHYRTYATIYRRPLRIWAFGRWVIGGAHVRAAWARVDATSRNEAT